MLYRWRGHRYLSVRELDRELRLMGPINPLALQEFEELQDPEQGQALPGRDLEGRPVEHPLSTIGLLQLYRVDHDRRVAQHVVKIISRDGRNVYRAQ